MFLSMYGASLSAAEGSTWNFCTIAGHTMPSRIGGEHQQRDPDAGSSQVRRNTLANSSTAQISAMNIRMFFDGSTAWSRA